MGVPRAGWVKPVEGRRLAEFVSVGLLVRVFPPGLVDEVIAGADRRELRVRSLPARVVVYFVIGLALFGAEAYGEVFAQLTAGLSWVSRWRDSFRAPSTSALAQARARLGAEPLEGLFRAAAEPLASLSTPGAWAAGRRVVALDGTCFDVADTPANAALGRPGTAKGEQAAFPQIRVVGLVECGTHAIFDAEVGPCTTSEVELARRLVGRLTPGMLCLADRGFYGFRLWQAATATGAGLVWRMRASQRLDPLEVLPDGSYLAKVYEVANFRRRGEGVVVRVIEYRLDDGRGNDTSYTLITNLLDPHEIAALDLALLYSERWEIENTLDELKTHQRGARTVLRSKSPDMVKQELWGHLCCHYAIRTLMWEAADHHVIDPDRASFIAALRIVRRSTGQPVEDFSPSAR